MSMSWGFWTNYFLALTIVALMLGGLYVLARGLARGRVFASADRRLVTVLETTMLSQHVLVHVVKVGARYLLIGGSNGSISTLAELAPDEVDGWLAQQRETAATTAQSLKNAVRWVRNRNS
jgi:flagellar biogenesis protein FliO